VTVKGGKRTGRSVLLRILALGPMLLVPAAPVSPEGGIVCLAGC
jgi:hypothetical protein